MLIKVVLLLCVVSHILAYNDIDIECHNNYSIFVGEIIWLFYFIVKNIMCISSQTSNLHKIRSIPIKTLHNTIYLRPFIFFGNPIFFSLSKFCGGFETYFPYFASKHAIISGH